MLTVDKYISLMEHALGKTPASGHELLATFNDAGRALFTWHPWRWRSVGPVDLSVVHSQGHVDLPNNFAAIETAIIDRSDSDAEPNQFTGVAMVSRERIMQLRAGGPGIHPSTLHVYFPQFAQVENDQPSMKALIYPRVHEGAEPTLSICYQSRWATVIEEDVETAVPNIPAEWEFALKLICREFVGYIENQSKTIESEAAIAELTRLMREDGGRQMEHGPIIGAVQQRRGRSRMPHIRVGDIDVF